MTEAIVNVSALMIPLATMIVSLMGLIGYLIKHIYQQNEKLAKASAENKRLKEKIVKTDNVRKSVTRQIEIAISRFNDIFDETKSIDSDKYSIEGSLEKLNNSWYSIGLAEGYETCQNEAILKVTDSEETEDGEIK